MDTKTGMQITLIKQHISRLLEKTLAEYGIDEFNGPQGRILYALWHHDSIAIQELANRTGLKNATLTSMLDRMVRKQLIERQAAPNDRRKTIIVLTAKARALEEKFQKVSDRMNQLTCKGFSMREISQLENFLGRILQNVREAENTASRDLPRKSKQNHLLQEVKMDKQELVKTVQEMISAPSCCSELKAAGRKWLDALGTQEEKAAASALLQEIKEDVATIDHVIAF